MAGVQPSTQTDVKAGSSVAFMLRALRYRNYRLFFGGQFVSLVGNWITTTATSWLVYRLTGSALLLGVVGFASQFPSFLLTPFAGIFVDRWNRHRLLVITQTLSMIQSFALAAAILTGTMTMPWLIVLSVFQALVNAFDTTARQAFVVTLIEDKKDLGNAIALNSSMFNAARLVGPTVAGAIIAVSSEGWCFFIDGISYLAVLGSLLAMRLPAMSPSPRSTSGALAELKDGWTYVSGFTPIRSILLLIALVCLVGMPYTVLLPIFAATILKGGARTLGLLMAAAGGGALLGALWLAGRRSAHGLSRIIPMAAALFGLGLMAFARSRTLWLSLLLMIITSFGFMVQVASSNTLLQTIIDDGRRGRVMSFFLMAYFGTTPFGSLLAGVMSERVGVPWTLALGGGCCVAGAIWFSVMLPSIEIEIAPILRHVHGEI